MPSMVAGVEIKNDTKDELIVYVCNLDNLLIKRINFIPKEKKFIGLTPTDGIEHLPRNIYSISAINKLNKVYYNRCFVLKDIYVNTNKPPLITICN